MPMNAAVNPTRTVMINEICVPRMVMANESRPTRSWPNGWSPRLKGNSCSVGRPPFSIGGMSV